MGFLFETNHLLFFVKQKKLPQYIIFAYSKMIVFVKERYLFGVVVVKQSMHLDLTWLNTCCDPGI